MWRRKIGEIYEPKKTGLGGVVGAVIIFLIIMAAIQKSGGPSSSFLPQNGRGQSGIVVPPPVNPPSRPLLGVMAVPVVLENGSLGMQIGQVFPGGPAQRVGLEPGDMIVRVDGRPLVTPDDMSLALSRSNGQPVLTVFRPRYGQFVNIMTPLN